MTLDAHSARPLYLQLADRIAARIAAGELAPGAQLPTEAALQRAFGISRVTVRQALALLVRSGQLQARRGKGTFVTRPQLQHDLGVARGFRDALRRQGIEPQTELLEFAATAGAADPLRPPEMDLPVRLRRLYVVEGRPFAVVQAYLPAAAAALGEARARRLVVYEILQHFLGLRIDRTEVEVRCAAADARIARELQLPRRAPVMQMLRTSYTGGGSACEHMRIAIVAERYSFRLSVPGPLEIASALVSAAADPAARPAASVPARPVRRSHQRDEMR